jgi:ankyrin repeat protein
MVAGLTDNVKQIERLLFKEGAGNQALLDAVARDDPESVRALLDAGVDVNTREEPTGCTPLIAAAYHGSLETVKLLLESGADVNAATVRGITALMAASLDDSNIEIAKLLLDKGAHVNAKTKSGKTPLQISQFFEEIALDAPRAARGVGQPPESAMIGLLKQYGAK